MDDYRTPILPLPEPIRGSALGSFAHDTVTKRFPKIAQETMRDNEFPAHINQHLDQLIRDIPFTPLRELHDLNAPDVRDWDNYLEPYAGKNWLEVPWFFAEMYFYRRIIEAVGYHEPGAYQGYDPYRAQKERVLESAAGSTQNLTDFLERSFQEMPAATQPVIEHLLVLNVWGNQADLSMWSAHESRPDHQASADQYGHLLANDSAAISKYLLSADSQLRRVDFILDNYGPEIIHDIGLADYLLGMDITEKIRFHAKPTPHYVSDAIILDIHSALEYLGERQDTASRQLAQRFNGYIQEGRLEMVDNYFWTSPTYFWEMPGEIHQELSESDLVISKGDANYRRLAGDLDWPPTTPFQEVVRYFPTSLLALRVHKAELALGLTSSQVSQLDQQDPGWKVNGRWAVIQFFQK